MSPVLGWATRLGVVVLGLLVGVLGAVEHRQRTDLGGIDLPWGLVLALGAAWCVALAADRLVVLGSAWFTVGWGSVLLLQQLGGDGSYLVADDGLGWAFMVGGLAGLVLVVVWASRRDARASVASRS
ncbi:MAG: hypothetical protein PGN07_08305 [Aeromicrobium erythreum]